MKTLDKNLMKYINQENHLGTMRFDFADGDTCIANRWFSYQEFSNEEIPEIQGFCNEIMFDRFNTFNKVIEFCKGTGYDCEKVFYEETEHFAYAIKFIPVKGDYNGYIFVHRKNELKTVA